MDDVTTIAGYWREPDGWTNPAFAQKNDSQLNGAGRRASSPHFWNANGEVAPFWRRAIGEFTDLIETLGAKLGFRRSRVAFRHEEGIGREHHPQTKSCKWCTDACQEPVPKPTFAWAIAQGQHAASALMDGPRSPPVASGAPHQVTRLCLS